MSSSELPIDTYHEKLRWVLDRKFDLYPDKVICTGSSKDNRFESVVLISDLTTQPDRLWVRTVHYQWALVLFLVVTVGCLLLPFTVPPAMFFFAISPLPLLVTASALFAVRCSKRVEFLRFKNKGGNVILDIGRVGPDAERFESFTNTLKSRIADVSTAE